MSFADVVHAVVKTIPKGSVMTYAEVAQAAGRPRAYRAVGNILTKNRSQDIPCHRVIRSDGGLGGYAWGAEKKRAILKKEGYPGAQ
jgi:AraC family transcriptional regulator of adaptative response/methylated-DNA-[protein]-cysteine methyltransferase